MEAGVEEEVVIASLAALHGRDWEEASSSSEERSARDFARACLGKKQ